MSVNDDVFCQPHYYKSGEGVAWLTPTLEVPVKLQVKVSELQKKTKKSQSQVKLHERTRQS